MNKIKFFLNKRSVSVLSLVFIVLGIGFFSWAAFNIFTQSYYPMSTSYPVNTSTPNSSLVLSSPNKILYPRYPVEGDHIGILTIPALNREIPIYQGTRAEEFKKGVGHFIQSVLPGEGDNCVFSGHRDTVFRQLGNLIIGDQLIVQTSAGIFTYEVSETRIVHEDDKTVIVPTPNAVLTLTTCYPFNFIGNAPDRYIVSAVLVKSE